MAPTRRCPNCGSTRVNLEQPSRYEFDWSGLSGVVLAGDGVVLLDCEECRESTTTIRNLPQLLQVIGLALVLGGPGLTGQELAYLRSLFEISQGELARATGRGRRETIADWEARGAAPIFRTTGRAHVSVPVACGGFETVLPFGAPDRPVPGGDDVLRGTRRRRVGDTGRAWAPGNAPHIIDRRVAPKHEPGGLKRQVSRPFLPLRPRHRPARASDSLPQCSQIDMTR